MLVKLKSWADCVVEAAKIMGTPPNRLANTARNKNNLLLNNRKDIEYLIKLLLDDHLNKGKIEFIKAKIKLKEALVELDIDVTEKLGIIPQPMSQYLKEELDRIS